MAAIMNLDPSLIQYLGGGGRAFGAIGNSMSQIGQAKLDLEQKDRENKKNQAYLDLQTNYYNDAKTAKQEAKQEKFDSNVAANSYLYSAMGKDVPGELTNERAQLGMLDPSIVSAAMKTEKDKYAATDGGLIYNTGTGQMVNDYRDKNGGDPTKGFIKVPSIVNGKYTETYYNPKNPKTPALQIQAPGTPVGVYGQYVADSIGDTNTGQRPAIKNNADEVIGATDVMQRGGMPVRLSTDPRVAAKQREWLLPAPGGGWYVPKEHKASFMRAFPQ